MRYRIIKTREERYLPEYFDSKWKPVVANRYNPIEGIKYDTFEKAKSICLAERVEVTEFNDDSIDWRAKLIELSGMAMQGLCANNALTEKSDEHIARVSISQAKELIKQLQEELKCYYL